MTDPTIQSAAIRAAVARLVATYFVRHLEAEVLKPDAVLLEDYPDEPVREITRTWIARVRQEFAIGPDEKLPEKNIFSRWCDMNGKFEYHDSGLFGYNRIYLHRLLDLREGNPSRFRQLRLREGGLHRLIFP
jgi:hypothetical protein